MALDMEKLDQLLGRGVVDFGATMHAALIAIGDRLGLYKALAQSGPMTPTQLAAKTGTSERYVREWLSSQAAGGYVTYDKVTGRFSLTEEQVFALADENSPAFLPGAFQVALAATRSVDKITEAFKTGKGVGWHEHDPELFVGTERFFRPGYAANLTASWIPALEGVEAKLKRGARVADVGCGHGASTVLMAEAYPASTFTGFDYHQASIDVANERAKKANVGGRVKFAAASAKTYPGEGYDFVTFFDCLHDMGDPVGAAEHVLKSLAKDGTWMIVEPYANDKLEDNLNPVGRVYYSASTLLCTPCSKAQEVGLALGAQAGESQMRDVILGGGFSRFRRATQTPFNLVFEARP
ncbi:MAG: class I SAM-dependent methyltransferase [Candidatus Acidiferrales bacterium]